MQLYKRYDCAGSYRHRVTVGRARQTQVEGVTGTRLRHPVGLPIDSGNFRALDADICHPSLLAENNRIGTLLSR
jgi:hypothetical protein